MRIVEVRFAAIEKADGTLEVLAGDGSLLMKLIPRRQKKLRRAMDHAELLIFQTWGKWAARNIIRLQSECTRSTDPFGEWGFKLRAMASSLQKRSNALRVRVVRGRKYTESWCAWSRNTETKLRYAERNGGNDDWRKWSQTVSRNLARRHADYASYWQAKQQEAPPVS